MQTVQCKQYDASSAVQAVRCCSAKPQTSETIKHMQPPPDAMLHRMLSDSNPKPYVEAKTPNPNDWHAGEQPALTPRRLTVLNTSSRRTIQDIHFTTSVLAVHMNKQR